VYQLSPVSQDVTFVANADSMVSLSVGDRVSIVVKQDIVGGRKISFNSGFAFTQAPTPSGAPGTTAVYDFIYNGEKLVGTSINSWI